jgi:4-carboxymuconolactone decarboxylase
MAITEAAQHNRDQLFPDHVSTLKATDPELVETFDNWVFDEVIEAAGMDIRLRLMVQLAALIACQAVNEYRLMLGGALNVGLTPVQAKEILYQAVPYVGMARAFDFLHATNEVFKERGIALPMPAQATTTAQTRFDKGLEAQKRIFGDRSKAPPVPSPADLEHILRFLSANCFGDYYTRLGLDLQTRELLTFAILASLGGCEPQLAAHVAGNLSMGNDRQTLIATVTQLLPYIGYPRTLNAIKVINEGVPA